MAKIEIMMLQDFSIGSTIKHKLCAELCDFAGASPKSNNENELKTKKSVGDYVVE